VDKYGQDGSLDNESIDQFLQMFREWSQVLPHTLRHRPEDSRAGDTSRDRGALIANIHVAGTYYFGVILITRQHLIQHVLPQLGEPSKASTMSASSGIVADRSQACVEAAIFLSQMCCEALDSGVFLGNMCIIKYVHSTVVWIRVYTYIRSSIDLFVLI
jgi:hypothetical protein